MKPKQILLILIWLMLSSAGFCQEAGRMDTGAFETLRRPAALFDHDAHNEKAGLEDCGLCHHVWENGKKAADQSSEGTPCAECHSPGGDNDVSLANAYHTQCRSCHFDKGMGPVLCGQCHKKETPNE